MECAFRPVITPETVADGLNNIENDLMYLKYDQCREKEVLELACQAAYRGNTLGLPRLMPEEILEKSKNKEEFNYFHCLIKFKGSPGPNHFMFQINVGKRRIRYRTTLNFE